MRIDAVVINASPLITLFRSGQADLLPRLFTHIVVPEAVWQEVVLDEWEDTASRDLQLQSWPLRAVVVSSPRVAAWGLGAGETAVLSHALANPPLRAVIDDMDARRCATTLGIPMLGTGGLLVLAKRRGLLPSVAEGIAKLRNAGLWLSDEIVQILKAQADE
jgi:predicted nucleic acid-binding protein